MHSRESSPGPTRRDFLKQSGTSLLGLAVLARLPTELDAVSGAVEAETPVPTAMDTTLNINGVAHRVPLDPRRTLLDVLRETIGLTGTKKGCDRGECGACTVHLDGKRALSCMTLAVMADGRSITTIEGLAHGDQLHPLQTSFIANDAFQCGYCTSGQIMSGIGCIREGHTGSTEEVAEFMSGNICRCAAYPQIRAAILETAKKGGV
jgi:xanthine dehydrogenase YagT iron-sulfur-binding subunit